MTAVPLGVGAYQRDYAQLPEIELVNRFLEEAPANQIDGISLLTRPGTTFLTSVGTGPIRVIKQEQGLFENNLFIVSGDKLFRFDGAIITPITGTIAGSKKPSITFVGGASFEHLYITDGLTTQRYSGEVAGMHFLVLVPTPDDLKMNSLATLASFVLLSVVQSHRFYWILPGETTIDPLNFASAESSPDDIIELEVRGDNLYMVGATTTEVWYANERATDVTLSFLRNRGFAFSQGGRVGSVVAVLNQIILVGRDSIVYQIIGGAFKRISTNGIEEQIRLFRVLTSDPFKAWTFPFDGHTFYVLTLDGIGTYVYDISTGQWSQFITEGSTTWNMEFGILVGIDVVAGDSQSSTIWQLDPFSFKDNHILSPESFEDMTRVVTGGLSVRQNKVVSNYSFYLTASMGDPDTSAPGTVELEYSDDGAHTFTSAGVLSVNSGVFTQRLRWWSLGSIEAPSRVFRVTDVGAIASISGADAGIDVGPAGNEGRG